MGDGGGDVWNAWNEQLSATPNDAADRYKNTYMYSSAVGVLLAVVAVLGILGPSWVTHAPSSALRRRKLLASRVILVGIVAAAITVGAPLLWQYVRGVRTNVSRVQ